MKFLEVLENWASDNSSELGKKGITIDFVRCGPSEKPAAYVDIDSARTLARITAWSSGELQMEALEAGSGKQLIVEAHTAKNSQEMSNLLTKFIVRID